VFNKIWDELQKQTIQCNVLYIFRVGGGGEDKNCTCGCDTVKINKNKIPAGGVHHGTM